MGIYGKISKLWIILERMLWASSMDNFGKNVMGFLVRLRGPMGPWAHGPRVHGPRVHGPMGPWAQGPWSHGSMGIGSMGPGSMGPWNLNQLLIHFLGKKNNIFLKTRNLNKLLIHFLGKKTTIFLQSQMANARKPSTISSLCRLDHSK